MFGEIEEQALLLMGRFNAQELSNTLWAYAKLGIQPGGQLLQRFEANCTQQMQYFNVQGVANTAWAYAALNLVPGGGLLEKLEAKAASLATSFDPQGLRNCQSPNTRRS